MKKITASKLDTNTVYKHRTKDKYRMIIDLEFLERAKNKNLYRVTYLDNKGAIRICGSFNFARYYCYSIDKMSQAGLYESFKPHKNKVKQFLAEKMSTGAQVQLKQETSGATIQSIPKFNKQPVTATPIMEENKEEVQTRMVEQKFPFWILVGAIAFVVGVVILVNTY